MSDAPKPLGHICAAGSCPAAEACRLLGSCTTAGPDCGPEFRRQKPGLAELVAARFSGPMPAEGETVEHFRARMAATEKPADPHPAPWRRENGSRLYDGNGDIILGTDGAAGVRPSPDVRALTEAAKELRDALEKAVEMVRWLAPFALSFAPPGSNLPTDIDVDTAWRDGRALLERLRKAGA